MKIFTNVARMFVVIAIFALSVIATGCARNLEPVSEVARTFHERFGYSVVAANEISNALDEVGIGFITNVRFVVEHHILADTFRVYTVSTLSSREFTVFTKNGSLDIVTMEVHAVSWDNQNRYTIEMFTRDLVSRGEIVGNVRDYSTFFIYVNMMLDVLDEQLPILTGVELSPDYNMMLDTIFGYRDADEYGIVGTIRAFDRAEFERMLELATTSAAIARVRTMLENREFTDNIDFHARFIFQDDDDALLGRAMTMISLVLDGVEMINQ